MPFKRNSDTPPRAGKPASGDAAGPRVLVAIDVFSGYQRRIIRGVVDYNAARGRPWRLLFHPRPAPNVAERLVPFRDADAVILHGSGSRALDELSPTQRRRLQRRKTPLVFAGHRVLDVPCAFPDEQAVARLAFDHLRTKGFTRLAFFGSADAGSDVFKERYDAFAEAARDSGLPAVVQAPIQADWPDAKGRTTLLRWIRQLPKPVGLFCANTDYARRAVAACGEAGFDVPTRVAIVGVDPDDLICDMVHPPLTTIDQGMRRVGYEAARLLDHLLAGRTVAPSKRVPPLGVEPRQSTDTLAVEDVEVAQVLRAIAARLHDPDVGAGTILKSIPASRRSLEQRFRRETGRGVQEELVRRRVERAKELLAATGPFAVAKLDQVALQSGFSSAARLSEAFLRIVGERPGQWRRTARTTPIAPVTES
jgi:LacI family transcriptional regulator